MPADKAYDPDALIECLAVRAITPVMPPKSNRKVKRGCDPALHRERSLTGRFSTIIRHFRGIAPVVTRLRETSLQGLASSAHSLGSNDGRP